MSWFELVPAEHAININQTWHVEVVGNTVKYISVGPQNTEIIIDYGSNAAALDAYQAFVDAAGKSNDGAPLELGDKVRLRGDGNQRTSENLDYTILNIPDAAFPWWALLGSQTLTLYVMSTNTTTILEKVPP